MTIKMRPCLQLDQGADCIDCVHSVHHDKNVHCTPSIVATAMKEGGCHACVPVTRTEELGPLVKKMTKQELKDVDTYTKDLSEQGYKRRVASLKGHTIYQDNIETRLWEKVDDITKAYQDARDELLNANCALKQLRHEIEMLKKGGG